MNRLVLSLAALAILTSAAHADTPKKMNVLFVAVGGEKGKRMT